MGRGTSPGHAREHLWGIPVRPMRKGSNVYPAGYNGCTVAASSAVGALAIAACALVGWAAGGHLLGNYAPDLLLRYAFAVNAALHAGVGVLSLTSPRTAALHVYGEAWLPGPAMRLIGAGALVLAFGSLCGIYEPGQFGPVLVFQVSCTCLWFLTGVIPDVAMSYPVPILLAGASGLWASALCRIVPWTIIPPAALRVHQDLSREAGVLAKSLVNMVTRG